MKKFVNFPESSKEVIRLGFAAVLFDSAVVPWLLPSLS